MFDNLTAAIGHIRSGKLRALAVTTSTRYPELPDLPTMQEAGVPGYEVTAWFGIMLPKGAPKEVISRINGEVNKALLQADMKEKLLQQGALATAWTPQEFGSFIHDEVVKWGKVVTASGAKVE
jgi:tripartite-type tricarboxylate transporter receptor subunit TctC